MSAVFDFKSIARKANRMEQKAEFENAMPKPILCTKTEGGEFHPWPLPRQSCVEDHRVHSIFFDDGSVLDSCVGWRPGNVSDGEFYVKFASSINVKI